MRRGAVSARSLIEQQLERAGGPAARGAYTHLDPDRARASADAADALRTAGRDAGALGGLGVSIKDLFDVAGEITHAGSRVPHATTPAATDAPAVARLRAAGAALIGRTQMTEFAFSGVGINPHQGTPANVPMGRLDLHPRIPGGSTSGGAVSVAAGAAWLALGSDTGGSIRIPAALQGLVGFKNTQALTPTQGAVPLSTSLDTACAITCSVRDAVLAHEVLSGRPVPRVDRPLAGLNFGVPVRHFLDGMDEHVSADFERSLSRLSRAGARLRHLDLRAMDRLPELTAQGGITSAEAWSWHAPWVSMHERLYDPRVLARVRRGAAIGAATLAALHARRRTWIDELHGETVGLDALLCPTVPIVAPRIDLLSADDDRFFHDNALLLRNPSVVNLYDGCAISLPCHRHGTPPTGLMLWTGAGRDDALLMQALAVEAALEGGR
jgi:amidase/aspartyl-tRNA(Asn)/glutamyl-tRNA(Gln) amidotransferase subunit A